MSAAEHGSDRSGAARYVVGIDLGTTNSAVAWAEPRAGGRIAVFPVPQLVGDGEVRERETLPSAIYLAGEHDVPAGALALPWRSDDRTAVGLQARRLGARVAGRLVTSAKSWLCHGGVDREARILPWGGAADAPRLSAVEASARIVSHLREAWDFAHPDAPLSQQDVVLTVPASFDEIARELTVRAAAAAGLERIRLLEEPQAAIYAWIAAHEDWRERLAGIHLVLVVDVGGGTTDFSLVAVRRGAGGLTLERVAVGDHLLLGGDNMDIALARQVAARRAAAAGLDAARWQQLVDQCREAKERLLGEDPPADVVLSIAGRGRGVVAGAISERLAADEAVAVVRDGFFPIVAVGARPRSRPEVGLAEFGLPFAADPEVTRHLSEFLASAAARLGEGPVRPEAVLFNGGALTPRVLRDRILDALESWCGTRPRELPGSDLDLAVARGATAYGLARRGLGVRIGGGAARAYYVGLAPAVDAAPEATGSDGTAPPAAASRRVLCIAPRGMEEGDEIEIRTPEFEVIANAAVRFPIYASSVRAAEAGGAIVDADPSSLVALPPLTGVLRFGRSLQPRPVPVHLRAVLTETGTLELWCHSRDTTHRWRMSFDLRGAAPAASAEGAGANDRPDGDAAVTPAAAASASRSEMVVAPERLASARELLERCFGSATPAIDPVALTRELETALDAGKDGWSLAAIRELWDALIGLERGRERTPAHEARWLNLAGFLLRPGFGDLGDPLRIEQIWRLFDRGLRAPGATQARAEWWTMWKRVAGGLSRQQQQALHQDIRPVLLPETRKKGKPSRWKAGPQELREMWQVAGALERIAAGSKLEMLRALAPRVVAGKASDAELWAFGRLAARSPVYGPANTVVEPAAVEPWLRHLAAAPWPRPTATCLAVAQVARLTGDRARDVAPELREEVARRLDAEAEGGRLARWLRERVEIDVREQALVLAESLPVGLRIAGDVGADSARAS